MNKEIILAAAIVAGFAASGATARDGGSHRFSEIDADGNGQVTQEEMAAHVDARFAAADTDGDGFLDTEELMAQAMARAEGRAARMLERLDSDGDGALSAEELEQMGKDRGGKRLIRMLDRMDADGDGKLARAEMGGRHDPAKRFARLDSDGNGTLSEEEFAQARKHGHKHRSKRHSE